MVSNINQIVYQLFQKETLEQVSENELRYFIRQYPYAGTGHLLLAKKLQLDGEKRAFEREISVTSVYFTNPAWLQFVLQPTVDEAARQAANYYGPGEDAPLNTPEETAGLTQVTGSDSGSDLNADLTSAEIENPAETIAGLHTEVDKDPLSLMDFQHEITASESAVTYQETTDLTTEAPETAEHTIASATENTIEQIQGEVDFVMSAGNEAINHEAQNENGSAEFSSGETIGLPQPDQVAETIVNEQPAEDALLQDVKPILKLAPIDASGVAKLEFDPYHTIDYFASQGIKLKLEDYSKDKLGQQLKSFTEWIRSMKRLPQQPGEINLNDTDQHSIRRIAEHSVEEKEVLTESMAEVWAKQGNYEKARQVYRKLSLQNPAKSVYFAAKIEQLKVL